MRALCVLTLGAVLGMGTTPEPTPQPAPGAVTDSHRRAAEELIDLLDFDTMMSGQVGAMADAMAQQNAELGAYRDVIVEWAATYMTWNRFRPKFIEIYTEAFTESEIRDMLRFYDTPTGRKALQLMPELMRRGALLGMQVAQEHQPELERMMNERRKQLEQEKATP